MPELERCRWQAGRERAVELPTSAWSAYDPPMTAADCRCLRPPFHYTDFESRAVGVDEAAGRFAEVSIERCCACDRKWLRYFFELEAFSESGRWYRVPVSDDEAASVTTTTALELMSRRSWYFYGGSYFATTGKRCDHPLEPRLT